MRKLSYLLSEILVAGLAVGQPLVHLKGLKRSFTGGSAALEAQLKTRTLGRSHVLVQFADAPHDDQVKELENRGAAVLTYIPDYALSISVSDDVSLENTGVQAVGRLRPEEKISPDLAGSLAPGKTVTVVAEFYLD